MSFNGSGTFVRIENWTTDAANGVLIRSDRMDTDSNDFASGLTNCICKDGQSTTSAIIPFSAGLKVNDGVVGTPSIAFTSETSSGLYRISSGNVGVTVTGTRVATFNSGGLDNTAIGAGTPSTGAFTNLTASGTVNKVTITQPAASATLTIANTKTLTVSNTLTFTGTDGSSVAFGSGGTAVYTSNNLSVFAATTSAQLAGIISDETGTGALVFAGSPALTGTPTAPTASTSTSTTQLATTAFANPGSTLTSNGVIKFAGGGIMQYGQTGNVGGGGTSAVTLPLTFPNNFFSVVITSTVPDSVATSNNVAIINSTAQFTITNKQSNTTTFYWQAVGF